MKNADLLPAWGSILRGRRPFLSIEITRECPLRCPGCYAYELEHLGAAGPLRQLNDQKGEALIAGVLGVVRRYRPIHLTIVGGEPLVRYRELDVLLPKLSDMGVEVMVVTSAVRPIPPGWKAISRLSIAVSVDGLQPEHDRRRAPATYERIHDRRRAPATYERILQHIAGQRINIHCTVTRQQVQRRGYLEDFSSFWSGREEVRRIWFSLYTPQDGEQSEERLTPGDRRTVLEELARLRKRFEKVDMPDRVLEGFLNPPGSPQECIFAQITTCLSADLTTGITPCQFGGRPVCAECGCIASAGLASFAKYKLAGLVPVAGIFTISQKVGERLGRTFE